MGPLQYNDTNQRASERRTSYWQRSSTRRQVCILHMHRDVFFINNSKIQLYVRVLYVYVITYCCSVDEEGFTKVARERRSPRFTYAPFNLHTFLFKHDTYCMHVYNGCFTLSPALRAMEPMASGAMILFALLLLLRSSGDHVLTVFATIIIASGVIFFGTTIIIAIAAVTFEGSLSESRCRLLESEFTYILFSSSERLHEPQALEALKASSYLSLFYMYTYIC